MTIPIIFHEAEFWVLQRLVREACKNLNPEKFNTKLQLDLSIPEALHLQEVEKKLRKFIVKGMNHYEI